MLVFNSAYAANEDKVDVDKVVVVKGGWTTRRRRGQLVAQEIEAFEPTPDEVAAAAEAADAQPIVRRLAWRSARCVRDLPRRSERICAGSSRAITSSS